MKNTQNKTKNSNSIKLNFQWHDKIIFSGWFHDVEPIEWISYSLGSKAGKWSIVLWDIMQRVMLWRGFWVTVKLFFGRWVTKKMVHPNTYYVETPCNKNVLRLKISFAEIYCDSGSSQTGKGFNFGSKKFSSQDIFGQDVSGHVPKRYFVQSPCD